MIIAFIYLGGWIHSVAFSPCGNKICWVAHNSSICVADATKGNAVMRLYTEHLPFLSCIWIGSNNIVAAVNNVTLKGLINVHYTNQKLLFNYRGIAVCQCCTL